MLWLVFTAFLALFVYLKVYQPLQYWEKKKVPYEKPWPFIGNMGHVVFRTKAMAHILQDLCNKFKGKRYFGFYQFSLPTLVVQDLDLIKQITVKDFDVFTDHIEFLPKTSDPLWSKNVFAMEGKDWHEMRAVLSPAFTSSKMKMMFVWMKECSEEFAKWMEKQVPTTLEVRDTFQRFTNNVIASTAFGIKVNSLTNQNDEFFKLGKEAFNFEGLKTLKFFGYSFSPLLMKILNVKIFDDYTRNFFLQIVKNTIRQREEAGLVRLDMIHLLREAQKGRLKNEEGDETYSSTGSEETNKMLISDEDFAAQAMVFFFGGFDTIATLLGTLAYEVAVNPDIQLQLAEEVARTKEECEGELTYQKLLGMKYMDMVVSETLRMWTPALFINRKSVKPYTIQPKASGEEPLHLKPGSGVWIPIYSIHRNPEYFPNPDKFDPERFSDENKHKIAPFTYMPFGFGPRICIAQRFAILEAKTLLFHLLDKFELYPVQKTNIPFVLSKSNINLVSENGNWLGLKLRNKN